METCEGVDRRKACYKCSKEGHVVKDCPNDEECPVCNKTGHKANSGRCREFKRALSIARKLDNNENKIIRGMTTIPVKLCGICGKAGHFPNTASCQLYSQLQERGIEMQLETETEKNDEEDVEIIPIL